MESDFGVRPSIDERLVRELASMAFVSRASNQLLLGPPGVGQTHLAVALLLKAIEAGYEAYIVKTYNLMEDPKKASAEERLRRRRRVQLASILLNIDEFVFSPYNREATTVLFSFVAERCERGIINLASNKRFAE